MIAGTRTLRGPGYEVVCTPMRDGGWLVEDATGRVSEYPNVGDPYHARDLFLAGEEGHSS